MTGQVMSPVPAMAWDWQPRQHPAKPQAAVAWGEVARRLHARLLLNADVADRRLHATAHRDALIVTGAATDLPWVDGIEYACTDERAPGLWLPTHWQPAVPLDLLGQALTKALARSPLLLWHAPRATVPLDRQLPLSAALLQRIANHWAGR